MSSSTLDLVVLAALEGHRAVDVADQRVVGLDAAVEDADRHALAGRPAPGPLAGDALRPVDADRDLLARAGGQAPGRKALGGLRIGLLLRHLGDGTAAVRHKLGRRRADGLDVGEAAAQLIEHAPIGLEALGQQGAPRGRLGASARNARRLRPGRRSRRAPCGRWAAPVPHAPSPWARVRSIPISRASRSVSYPLITSPAHLTGEPAHFFPRRPSRSLSRQREMRLAIVPGREAEGVADRAVALVLGEEAVEDLPGNSPAARPSPRARRRPPRDRRARPRRGRRRALRRRRADLARRPSGAGRCRVGASAARSRGARRRPRGASRAARRRARRRPGRRPRRPAGGNRKAWTAIAYT